MITDINSEDRLVQTTFAEYLRDQHGWESVYAWNQETFGPSGTLGRSSERDTVLIRDVRDAIARLNPSLPPAAIEDAIQKITRHDLSRSMVQHNREIYAWIRDGVPVTYRDDRGQLRDVRARLIDFRNAANNRFLAVRELKIQGLRVPHYNRRADLVCFVNGLPLVFIELKAVYVNIRAGYDGNLSDYFDTIPHTFHHNAFLVVSNGDKARYGSVTSPWEHFHEWKRLNEKDRGDLDAKRLLDGMLAKDRLLDIVENFILFDESKPGATRKVVARNHQVLGVNRAVESVRYQEDLKKTFPPEERQKYRVALVEPKPTENATDHETALVSKTVTRELAIIERSHPDLGRLGVFWHTQGSGKSYSMIFFAEKVRRIVPGNFTFVIMTDREDLDDQIYRTFRGSDVVDEKTPRASSGEELKRLLQEDHRYIFSLIHKFNQDVTPDSPYSRRDDIVVISDEAHRTQAGRLARNMRLALPNAAFIGFTGTPLFKYDHLTRRIFGKYVSRYDFERSRQDGSTVKLVYENRGEKLGLTRLNLNDQIAEKIEQADLDPDQIALLEKLLGKDYEVITADDRLDKIAEDFVEHCSTRWESGKSMLVCIDKVTCARMFQRIIPRWQRRITELEVTLAAGRASMAGTTDTDAREKLSNNVAALEARIAWMRSTIVEIVISEGQNEVRDFNKWGFDIRPHRSRLKLGFESSDGKTVDVESAFKNPEHPFRVAIVCAMWLTGFDVECLSTLYIDKPMKAHTLMQAIARANRVYPGKSCGVIVDYNGMLRSLREALAQYATDGDDDSPTGGDGGTGDDGGDIVAPIEDLLVGLIEAIEAAEQHLAALGFDFTRMNGAAGFARIEAMRDAVEALYTSDASKRRFEIMARQVFSRFKALLMEPSVYQYVERHDNIEAIYKKLEERRDTADVTELLKELHRIVNEAIAAQGQGNDQAEGLTVDLSLVNFERLKAEFARRARRPQTALQDIRTLIETKLQAMLQRNPQRMDYYRKYQDIIADYNREKDRATVEDTFARLLDLAQGLDQEQQRAVREGLNEDELALFDLLSREDLRKTDRDRLKAASRDLLASLLGILKDMEHWTENTKTQAEVEVFILDRLIDTLPEPPYTMQDKETAAKRVYGYVWQRSAGGVPFSPAAA